MNKDSRVPVEGDDEDDDGARSVRSGFSVSTAVVAQQSQVATGSATALKASLKAFVVSMVKGRECHVQLKDGLQAVTLFLTPMVDTLILKTGESEQLPLQNILQVHHGLEALALDVDVALDANIVVLERSRGSSIPLHLGHQRSAEEFALFMRILTAMHRQQLRKMTDNDDARSECSVARSDASVKTAVIQQQLHSSPMASTNTDPKMVKKMFKMFKETMRRGRDFYVVKPTGELQDIECALSPGHDEFRMRWEFQTRNLPLRDFLHIHSCKEAATLGLSCPVDAHCATLELQTGECVTFKFGHVEACERFILCMRILVEQARPRFTSRSFNLDCDEQGPGGFGSKPALSRSGSKQSSGAGSSLGAPTQTPRSTQQAVAKFVKQMVAGCNLNVVGPSGAHQVQCSMDTDLKVLRIAAADGSSRDVSVVDVKAVHAGAEASKVGLEGDALEPLAATLELVSGDCCTFCFPDLEERDRFVLCMQAFANARRH